MNNLVKNLVEKLVNENYKVCELCDNIQEIFLQELIEMKNSSFMTYLELTNFYIGTVLDFNDHDVMLEKETKRKNILLTKERIGFNFYSLNSLGYLDISSLKLKPLGYQKTLSCFQDSSFDLENSLLEDEVLKLGKNISS